MSSTFPNIPTGTPLPTDAYPKHLSAVEPAPKQPPRAVVSAQEPPEHHHPASATASTALSAEALSTTDVSYVESLMGAIPAQKMEEILLKTGVPIPANLGPNFDTSV